MVAIGALGTNSRKLDGKGRMVLPANLRDGLGDRVVATIVLGSWRCISIYPTAQWERYIAHLQETSLAQGGKMRDIRRIILAYANWLDIDAAGRILIPSNLRSYASIAQEVTVNGSDDHIEIWDSGTWSKYIEAEFDDVVKFANEIGGF